jgi:hypothetical protein
MLHFDSHPDMGCIDAVDKQDWPRVRQIVPKILSNNFDKKECLELSDISTWVPTPVAQGLVDEVIWVCGWWCKQFHPGSYDLIIGRSKVDGLMKIGVPGDKWGKTFEYWVDDGTISKCADLEMVRQWKLHVVRFQKDCSMRREDVSKITSICKGSSWILDIDEDYLSTQNPFAVEFEQFFGKPMLEKLSKLWDAEVKDDVGFIEALEGIANEDTFLLSPAKFLAHKDVQYAISQLTCRGMRKAKAEGLLNEYRSICTQILPPLSNKDEYLHCRRVHGSRFVTDAASFSGLPHHISTLPEILGLLKSTRALFQGIGTPPGVCTVATSRCDEYTPEAQAIKINTLTLDLLTSAWSKSRSTRVFRRDYQSNLSIGDRYDPISPSLLALFLSRGKAPHL